MASEPRRCLVRAIWDVDGPRVGESCPLTSVSRGALFLPNWQCRGRCNPLPAPGRLGLGRERAIGKDVRAWIHQ